MFGFKLDGRLKARGAPKPSTRLSQLFLKVRMSYGLVFLLLEFMPLMLPFEAFRLLEFMPPPLILPFEALRLLAFMPPMLEFAPPVLLVFEPPMPVLVVLLVPVLVEVLLVVVVVLVFEVVVLAFPFVLSVAQPVQKAATASKAKSAKVLRIEFFSCNPTGQVVKSCVRSRFFAPRPASQLGQMFS